MPCVCIRGEEKTTAVVRKSKYSLMTSTQAVVAANSFVEAS